MSFNLTNMGRVFTQNVKRLQTATDLTRSELSISTDVSVATLKRIETARLARRTYRPAFSTVAKLALLSGVTIDQFVNVNLNFV